MKWEKNPYVLLGVATNATTDEIKAAFEQISKRLHPDVNPSAAAKVQFDDIMRAHALLTDPMERRRFDDIQNSDRTAGDAYFSLRVTPSKATITSLSEPQVVYLLTEVAPDPRYQTSGSQDVHLNLTLVLDRSNSMNGARMEKVKIAAHQIIENLHPKDVISVITFADRSDTIIQATHVNDKPGLKARISMVGAAGGTEIFQGLNAGLKQNRIYLSPQMVNHIILLTDGHTFGDQEQCLELAQEAAKEGIGISAMGLGNDWNDEFLDELASKTGGNTIYINSASAVVRFLNEQVRSLVNVFADRLYLSIAPEPDVLLESAFKIAPHPQPLDATEPSLPLGALQFSRSILVLLQFLLPDNMDAGFRHIARIQASGDILVNARQSYLSVADFSTSIVTEPVHEEPPAIILDALSKLTLYRLQERAQNALEAGDIAQATQQLQNLATRLLAMGQNELATQAFTEARRVAHTSGLSDQGRKALKYQTRYLLMNDAE